MANAGFKAEQLVLEKVSNSSGTVSFKNLDGKMVDFTIREGGPLHYGFTTTSKVDLIIHDLETRVQIKATGSRRAAILNMVPVRNLERLSSEQGFNIEPCLEILNILTTVKVSSVKVAEYGKFEDWEKLVEYFVFDGTATGISSPLARATHLLEVDDNGEMTIIDRKDAVKHLWENLEASIRTRKGKEEPSLHIRIGGRKKKKGAKVA